MRVYDEAPPLKPLTSGGATHVAPVAKRASSQPLNLQCQV